MEKTAGRAAPAGKLNRSYFRSQRKLSIKYAPVHFKVADEPIDPYLCYRLLYPGYRSWVDMKIVQRSLEDFTEYSLLGKPDDGG